MENRPICNIQNCNNIVRIKRHCKNGTPAWDNICSTHEKSLRNFRNNRIKIKKPKECIFCKFHLLLALHKHHIRKRKIVLLCANCHYILHGLFKTKKLNIMSIEELLGHLRVAYGFSPQNWNGVLESQNFPEILDK